MMMQGGKSDTYDDMGYIKKGKIFHLDGINKGETTNAWTDLVGGLVFNNAGSVNATSTENAWYFPGNNKVNMRYGGHLNANKNYTIEACFNNENTSACLFISNTSIANSPLFYFDHTDKLLFLQYNNTYDIIPSVNQAHCVSVNLNIGVHNGVQATQSSSTYWASDGNSYVGRRSRTGSYYKGYIYSIRIYDRRLTESEIINNQKVDNERFNLGLDI